jgi:anti-sigma regulatory factor (Ser/Thr protein kinase)
MSYFTCPNCGSSVPVEGFSSTPPPCPDCCARLQPSDVDWQRTPHHSAAGRRLVRLALVPDAEAPASARRALDALHTEIDPDALECARLMLSELVTNAVRHAAAMHGGHVDVSIWLSEHHLRIEVRDLGAGFNPPRRANTQGVGGWGLRIVDKLADNWGVASGEGALVWCDLALDQAQGSAADAERATA